MRNGKIRLGISGQCHCLPICFLTSDLTNSDNQKQEQRNSDCETSWLVYCAVAADNKFNFLKAAKLFMLS